MFRCLFSEAIQEYKQSFSNAGVWNNEHRVYRDHSYQINRPYEKGEYHFGPNEYGASRCIEFCDPFSCNAPAPCRVTVYAEQLCVGEKMLCLLVEASFAPVLVAQARQRADIHPYRAFGTYYYNINCRPRLWDGRPNPFADPRVRRAFSLAVDRAALVDHVTRRGEPPATTLVPPGVIPDYPSVEGMGFDPGRAQTELAAAGYPGGRGFPRVRLLYSTDGPHGLIAESIAGMWRRTLGVSVRLAGKEVQSFREDKKNQVFMIARASWYGDYLDPTTFLDTLRRENGNNDSAFADDAYEALLDAAEAEHHPGARLSRLAEAERYLVNEAAPIIPLYGFVHIAAFDPARAEGLNVNARMVLSLKDVTLRDNEGTSATAD